MQFTETELKEKLEAHRKWLNGDADGVRLNLTDADLAGANLAYAYLTHANLAYAYLTRANLTRADLAYAYLTGANLAHANLAGADLTRADLAGADLTHANLAYANLTRADLAGANLAYANLAGADLTGANLAHVKNLLKVMGVEPGNFYWKRFDKGLNNNGYQFSVGLNTLRPGETFAADERVLCDRPGFHFASRSWCAANYPTRPLEARIRIPLDAQICEPWATDGTASADRIEILEVYEVATGNNVTEQYRRAGEESV